jgi:hypothetical protein
MTELLKNRRQVTFVFEATVDDAKINPLGNSEDVQALDLALLRQFLQTDQERVKALIADRIASSMTNWMFEDIAQLLGAQPDEDFDTYCFSPAIDALPEPMRSDWQEVRDDPAISLSECLEAIIGCFETKLVESHITLEE